MIELSWLDSSQKDPLYYLLTLHYSLSFPGTLPSELFSLSNLLELDLNNNTLSGTIDGTENLRSLKFLQLHHNQFTGSIPAAMDQLVDLIVFTSYDTNLSGPPDSMCANRNDKGGKITVLDANCPCTCCTHNCTSI